MRRHISFSWIADSDSTIVHRIFWTDYMYVDPSPSDCVVLGTVHYVSGNKSHLIYWTHFELNTYFTDAYEESEQHVVDFMIVHSHQNIKPG